MKIDIISMKIDIISMKVGDKVYSDDGGFVEGFISRVVETPLTCLYLCSNSKPMRIHRVLII